MPRPQSSLQEKRIRNWGSQPSSSTKVTSDTISRTHKTLVSTGTLARDSQLAAQETKNTASDQQNRTPTINKMRKQMGYEAAKRKVKPDSKTGKGGCKASKAGSAWWTPVTHQSLYSTTSQFALRRQATTFTELEKLTIKIKRVLEDRTVSSGQPKAAVGPTRMKLQFSTNAKPNKQSYQSQQIQIPGKVNL